MDSLQVASERTISLVCLRELTRGVIRKFQWWNTILDIYIKHVIPLLALIQLLPPRPNGVYDSSDFGPLVQSGIPLYYVLSPFRGWTDWGFYLMCFDSIPVLDHFCFTGFPAYCAR